ncbi:MAG: peptide chain release factor N(5)-glutamine methyltransferase [Candidatus Pacebacteria bacterium]|nr:peptide chain release factor N(5)-glutamine methyltransferase [Candidatus Paceibacterota bacterium]MBP9842621.1 peptide chain release factor N(5)-glutamine methyltransferase [Candidatus Paceibacterota bacterium]
MPKEETWLLKEKYHGEKSDAFFADCKRLALGEPLGYLIGYVPFLDCKIWLDSHPLIPRPETEFWVEKAITQIGAEATKSLRILDLCAGSGCIGVSVAKAISTSIVDFSEIDLSHLPTIKKNITENDIAQERTSIYHTNLFDGIERTYDYILSNPPYIDLTLGQTDESVLKYEPYVALSGGLAGLEVIEDIIKRAPLFLNPHGQLWLEHDPEQTKAINALASESGFSVTTHNDQYGVSRYTILMLQ